MCLAAAPSQVQSMMSWPGIGDFGVKREVRGPIFMKSVSVEGAM